MRSGSGEPAASLVRSTCRRSGSGEPAAPRRQSLLREQARCALLPAATPRLKVLRTSDKGQISVSPTAYPQGESEYVRFLACPALLAAALGGGHPHDGGSARTRGVAAGRSAQRACERSSDWRRGAAGSPDPELLTLTLSLGLLATSLSFSFRLRCRACRLCACPTLPGALPRRPRTHCRRGRGRRG